MPTTAPRPLPPDLPARPPRTRCHRPRTARRALRRCLVAAGAAAALVTAATAAGAQEAATVFRQSCASCHTIGGGRLVGPDLKNVAGRKDDAWLVSFIADPKAALDARDPYAMKLKEEAQGAIMPPIAGMTRNTARALLDLIAAESKLPKSQFMGLQITDEPFTAADLARGRAIFVGTQALAKGGAACLSCHTVRGIGGLSGGRLGPDLTKVYERMKGRKNLASWMLAPATPTMQPLFANKPLTNEEILPLVAFLEERARGGGEDAGGAQLSFLLLGLTGAVACLVLADGAWRRRFKAVRRPLAKIRRTGRNAVRAGHEPKSERTQP